MQDLPLISFPQFFPQFTVCRKVSLFTAVYRHKLLKIYFESSVNRLRPGWRAARFYYMDTQMKITPDQTVDFKGLLSLFNLKRTAMYQLTRDPSFPAAYVITARHFLWDLEEVEEWFASRKGRRPQVRKIAVINPRDEIIDGIRYVKKVA
jgi:predicted DNA-binding transcriptional regulator AlpA